MTDNQHIACIRGCTARHGLFSLTATPTALTVEYVQPDDRDAAVTTDYVVVGR